MPGDTLEPSGLIRNLSSITTDTRHLVYASARDALHRSSRIGSFVDRIRGSIAGEGGVRRMSFWDVVKGRKGSGSGSRVVDSEREEYLLVSGESEGERAFSIV